MPRVRTKKNYPPEKFSVVEAKLENGKPVVGSINMAYKDYEDKSKYPWCLELHIALELKNVTQTDYQLKKNPISPINLKMSFSIRSVKLLLLITSGIFTMTAFLIFTFI